MGATNERCHFFETPFLIRWAYSQNGPCNLWSNITYPCRWCSIKRLCLENYTHPYKVWHMYNLKFSATSVSFSFRLYCWRGPMIAAMCLNGTPDNITPTKYGIISLFKRWRLYFFVNLVKEYSLALFQYHPFENLDAFMNPCPRLCVRNVVK